MMGHQYAWVPFSTQISPPFSTPPNICEAKPSLARASSKAAALAREEAYDSRVNSGVLAASSVICSLILTQSLTDAHTALLEF